jgi:hypothetical protein
MFTFSFVVRQTAALLCVGTIAWDYFRDPAIIGNFSLWALAIHFTYFQLPTKSRALAFMHPVSFIGACLVPVMYAYLLYWNPNMELKHMEVWEVAWTTVLIRAILMNAAPLLFHMIDVQINQAHLISAYRPKPKKLVYAWALCSFPFLGLLFEVMFPESEETSELIGISRDDFMQHNKYVCLVALLVSFAVLYVTVLSKAFAHKPATAPGSASPGQALLFPRDSIQNLQQYQGRQSQQSLHAHQD